MNKGFLLKSHIATHIGVNLTLLERTIFNALYYHLGSCTGQNNEYKISIQKLMSILGVRTRNYSKIYLAIKKLASTVVEWGILKSKTLEGDLIGVPILSKYHIKNGLIKYRFPEELVENIEKGYVKLSMSTITSLKTSFGVAIYENCASYSDIGQTGWISLANFKKIAGVSHDKYRNFRDLHSRVIKPAVNDINTHAEFKIDYILDKEIRKYQAIKFKIAKKDQDQVSQQISISSSSLLIKLIDLGFSELGANRVIKEYKEKYILEKITLVKEHSNVAGYPALLQAALKNDYKKPVANSDVHHIDYQKLELDYKAYKKENISRWLLDLKANQWTTLKEIIVRYVEYVTNNELYVEIFKNNFEQEYIGQNGNFLDESIDFVVRYLQHDANKIHTLNPPQIQHWHEFVNKKKRERIE